MHCHLGPSLRPLYRRGVKKGFASLYFDTYTSPCSSVHPSPNQTVFRFSSGVTERGDWPACFLQAAGFLILLKRHGKLRESRPDVRTRTSAAPSFHTNARVLLARKSLLGPGLNPPTRRKLSARRLSRMRRTALEFQAAEQLKFAKEGHQEQTKCDASLCVCIFLFLVVCLCFFLLPEGRRVCCVGFSLPRLCSAFSLGLCHTPLSQRRSFSVARLQLFCVTQADTQRAKDMAPKSECVCVPCVSCLFELTNNRHAQIVPHTTTPPSCVCPAPAAFRCAVIRCALLVVRNSTQQAPKGGASFWASVRSLTFIPYHILQHRSPGNVLPHRQWPPFHAAAAAPAPALKSTKKRTLPAFAFAPLCSTGSDKPKHAKPPRTRTSRQAEYPNDQ